MQVSRRATLLLATVLLAAVLLSSVTAVQAAPTITANTNPVMVSDGQTQGSVTITWDAENNLGAEVWLKVNDDKETRFSGASKGVQPTNITVGKKHTFTLYDQPRYLGPLRNPFSKVLASIEVNALNKRERTPPPLPSGDIILSPLPVPILPPAPLGGGTNDWPGAVTTPITAPAAGSNPAYIYAILPDGRLGWYRHDGAATGADTKTPGSWQGPRLVDTNFADFRQVFAGDNGSIYAITGDGILQHYQHSGFENGLRRGEAGGWLPPQSLSKGWGSFKQAFSGGGGVIYAITNAGVLRWYKHGYAGGKATWEGPKDIANKWGDFRQAHAGGQGIIYALGHDGKLWWYAHTGYLSGAPTWENYKQVGSGWGDAKQIFCAGDGLFYVIRQNGDLVWFREHEHLSGVKAWLPEKIVGGGWNGFQQVFALLSSRPVVPLPGQLDLGAPVIFSQNTDVQGGARDTIKEIQKAPFISAVQVAPDMRNVVISFASTQSTPPLVEIGRVPPQLDRLGKHLVFATDSGAFSRFAQEQKGRYTLDVDVQGEQLNIGTTYYYLINVFNNNRNDTNRPREQIVGQFTTLPQVVKIVWHSILVEDDSDETGAGEIGFWFWANYGQPSAKYADFGQRQAMNSGRYYYPDQTVILENAPDRLSLAASGEDDDNPLGSTLLIQEEPPLNGPHDTKAQDNYDVNAAKGDFDLSQYPGNNVTVPFRLNSMPGGDLRFVIHGRIEITRPVVKPPSAGSQSIDGAAAEKKSR